MRGRKAKLDKPIDWKLRIPTSVANAINDTIKDPLTGQPPLGARSDLTIKLYREYLEKQGVKLVEQSK